MHGETVLRTYLANLYIEDGDRGTCFALRYEAENDQEAERIAQENDWEYLGEFLWEEECPDDVLAIIEKAVLQPTEH